MSPKLNMYAGKRTFIDGRNDLQRDLHSKGLILTDKNILHQEQMKLARKQQQRLQEERLNKLEDQMTRIEKLLLDLVNK